MKKLHTLAALCRLGILTCISSCGTKTEQPSTIQGDYRGSTHKFNSAMGLLIYPGANYSTASGAESAPTDTLSFAYAGTDTGTYKLGPQYSNNMTLTTGGVIYSSQNRGAHGSIHITRLDASTSFATGTFSGTLMHGSNAHDSLPITQGSISVRYQF
jgi:hypothetical protein